MYMLAHLAQHRLTKPGPLFDLTMLDLRNFMTSIRLTDSSPLALAAGEQEVIISQYLSPSTRTYPLALFSTKLLTSYRYTLDECIGRYLILLLPDEILASRSTHSLAPRPLPHRPLVAGIHMQPPLRLGTGSFTAFSPPGFPKCRWHCPASLEWFRGGATCAFSRIEMAVVSSRKLKWCVR